MKPMFHYLKMSVQLSVDYKLKSFGMSKLHFSDKGHVFLTQWLKKHHGQSSTKLAALSQSFAHHDSRWKLPEAPAARFGESLGPCSATLPQKVNMAYT